MSARRPRTAIERGYRECARLTWRHGTTYFWGARLLPPEQRRHVHAVYALCRLADDIVDDAGATADADRVPATRAALDAFRDDFRAAVERPHEAGDVLAAVGTTVRESGIGMGCFDRFFAAMSMDLDTATYETWEDLLGYMEGSAAVIGEMMLPVLRPTSSAAYEPARALGFAFQLTNFLRDVGEDLDRGRLVQVLPRQAIAAAPLHAVYPSGRYLAPRVRLFVELLARRLQAAWRWDPAPPAQAGRQARRSSSTKARAAGVGSGPQQA